MGHTPGPWRLHKWGGEFTGDDTIDVLAAGDLEVCAVLPTYDDNGQPERLWATILADARLIAAAPELLAALKDAYGALDYAQAQVDSDADRMHLTRHRRRIKPIIDKAEGRSE